MPKVRVNGVSLYYEEYGKGEPVILVMGLGATHRSWRKNAPAISKEFRVIVFDNRGAGSSDMPDVRYTMRMMARDVLGLMDYLEIEKTHIVGASMGGCICQEFAINYPQRVKSLTLVVSSPTPDRFSKMYLMERREIAKGMDPGLIARYPYMVLSPDTVNNNPGAVDAWLQLEKGAPRQPLYAYMRQLGALLSHNVDGRLGRITAPTLIVAGELDLIWPPRCSKILHREIKGSKLTVLRGAAHAVHWERSEKLNRLLLAFLRRNSDSRDGTSVHV